MTTGVLKTCMATYKYEVIGLSLLCWALSMGFTGRWRLLRMTLPQIHAEARRDSLRTSWGGTILGLLGIALGFYGMFWL
jgi:hypothetical protein